MLKVSANLTRGWKLGGIPGFASSQRSNTMFAAQQQQALMPAPVAAAQPALAASDRVRSTVASLETMSSTHRISGPVAAQLAMPAPVPQLSLAGPADARGQLRYLHHRVAGASNNNVSRKMVR